MKNILLGGLVDDVKARWDGAVRDFKAKEAQFKQAGEELAANRDRYYRAGLGARYESLTQRGRFIQSTITATMDKIGAIYDWFKQTAGLGFAIPAIPFATLAGAIAIIGGFIVAYNTLREARDEYEIRQLPPEQQAEARRQKLNQPTLAGNISSTVWGIAAIAAIVLVLPQLVKKGR